jgi:uncharacterized SAM-binding protein YcdF (DUF218 family)
VSHKILRLPYPSRSEYLARPRNAPARPPVRWAYAAYGSVFGVLIWTAALRLGIDAIPDFRSPHMVLLVAVLGGFAALTKVRALLGVVGAAMCVSLLVVMYTPLAPALVRTVVRQDRLEPAVAVVVLDIHTQQSGELTRESKVRMLHSFALLREGLAKELVITRQVPPAKSPLPESRRWMSSLRFEYPLHEVGPAENTHDEAVAAAVLAREKGWPRVLLVSHPAHLRRAAATFKKQGLDVLCAPCPDGEYDLNDLDEPNERLSAFRDWLHEAIGHQIYRLRGWL